MTTTFSSKTMRLWGIGLLTSVAIFGGALTPAVPTAAAAPAAPEKPSSTVHPGAFCTHQGATGTSDKGSKYRCTAAKDGRLHWRSA